MLGGHTLEHKALKQYNQPASGIMQAQRLGIGLRTSSGKKRAGIACCMSEMLSLFLFNKLQQHEMFGMLHHVKQRGEVYEFLSREAT